jgi:anti-sigma28 factor (negative regulator of flagellin synthesis)
MVTIQGVGGLPEPKPERTDKIRNDRGQEAPNSAAAGSRAAAKPADDVAISDEARLAQEAARVRRLAANQSEIRADRVAAAREFLERGDYKNPDVVSKVAEQLLKYLD